jgi:hypothetical protein
MSSPTGISNNASGGGFKSFINMLFKYDGFIVFGGMGMVILAAILITVLYEEVDNMRHNILFNNALAVCMGIFFIYLVFTFMGQNITIFQVKIDFGLILFLMLGIIIIFVFGD